MTGGQRPRTSGRGDARAPPAPIPGLSRQLPVDPVAERAPHDQLFVLRRQPRYVVGEHRDTLPPRARHPRDVGPPEHSLGAEGVVELLDMPVDVAIRIRLARVARRPGRLQRHVTMLRRRYKIRQVRPRGVGAPEMIDDQLEPRMTLRDLADDLQETWSEKRDRQSRALGRGPEPVD